MSVQRGEIVQVDFPYADQSGSTVRPALVIQADDLNNTLQSVVLAMITSSRRRMIGHPSQLLIETSHADFPQSGLRKESIIQCNMLMTLVQKSVLNSIGSLSDQTMNEIDECLKAALGIS